MATKRHPGEFDCYGKADADEPLFTLRAKDPLAPVLVRLWAELRAMSRPIDDIDDDAQREREARKRTEAAACAEHMEDWYETRRQQAAENSPATPTARPAGARRSNDGAAPPPSRS